MLIGGGPSRAASLVPQDIEIRANHFFRPDSWRIEMDECPSPSSNGLCVQNHWWVKNHLELKAGKRVRIAGNFWCDPFGDQAGTAAGLRVAQEGSPADIVETADVQFVHNKVANAGHGFSVSSDDPNTLQTRCVRVSDNLFYGTSTPDRDLRPGRGWGLGRFMLATRTERFGIDGLTVVHNTALNAAAILVADTPDLMFADNPRFTFADNITYWRDASQDHSDPNKAFKGISGSGTAEGSSTLQTYFQTERAFRRNLIAFTADPVSTMESRYGVPPGALTDPSTSFFHTPGDANPNSRPPRFRDVTKLDFRLDDGSGGGAASEYLGQCSHRFQSAPHDLGAYLWSTDLDNVRPSCTRDSDCSGGIRKLVDHACLRRAVTSLYQTTLANGCVRRSVAGATCNLDDCADPNDCNPCLGTCSAPSGFGVCQ